MGGEGRAKIVVSENDSSQFTAMKVSKRGTVYKDHLVREAKVMQKLGIPVLILDNQNDDKVRILMKAYEGKSLDELLKDDLPEKIKLQIMLEVLKRLREVFHDKGFVHGDFQPRNILVDYNKDTGKIEVNIIDFGFATEKGQMAERNNGSWWTIEQQKIQPAHPATDIYNLGEYIKLFVIGGILKNHWYLGRRNFITKIHPQQDLQFKQLISAMAPESVNSLEDIPTVDKCISMIEQMLLNQNTLADREPPSKVRKTLTTPPKTLETVGIDSLLEDLSKTQEMAPKQPRPKEKTTTQEEDISMLLKELSTQQNEDGSPKKHKRSR